MLGVSFNAQGQTIHSEREFPLCVVDDRHPPGGEQNRLFLLTRMHTLYDTY